jgi:hypothetical protein
MAATRGSLAFFSCMPLHRQFLQLVLLDFNISMPAPAMKLSTFEEMSTAALMSLLGGIFPVALVIILPADVGPGLFDDKVVYVKARNIKIIIKLDDIIEAVVCFLSDQVRVGYAVSAHLSTMTLILMVAPSVDPITFS